MTDVGVFAILFMCHRIASPLFQFAHGFSLAEGALRCHLCLSAHFSTSREDTSSVVSALFMRLLSLFLHPDNTVTNFRRSMAFRMSRNNSQGTATSSIWKTILLEWRTTFAPILISFSRNVVMVQ
jgi:hypothetical protein